jgi:hypothetical protein
VLYEWLDNDRLLYRAYRNPRAFRVVDLRTGRHSQVSLEHPQLRAAQTLLGLAIPLQDGKSFVTFVEYGSGDAWWVPLNGPELPEKLLKWPDGRFVCWMDQGRALLMDQGGFWDNSGKYRPRQYELYAWPELKELRRLPRTAELPVDDGTEWVPLGWSQAKEHYYSRWGKQTQLAAADPFTGGFALTPVELPTTRHVVEAVISPSGEEIFWNLNKLPGDNPGLGEATFWVSRADGTDFRKVAQTGEAPSPPHSMWRLYPNGALWRPDGTAVVIGYRDGVFLLPVR